MSPARFVDLPWFGNSEFYAGLQLADFATYLVDVVANRKTKETPTDLELSFDHIRYKIQIVAIP